MLERDAPFQLEGIPLYQKPAIKQSTVAAKGAIALRRQRRDGCAKPEWTMLDVLRNAAGTWVAKTLLSVLLVSFAVWGISGKMMGGFGVSDKVVTAGGTSVSANEYRLAYDRQIAILSQQFGQRITREQATALGIDNQVLSQLVAGAVLDEQARKMGLGLSKDRLAELTREDPAFHGPDGQFSREQFDHVLQQVGMRPEAYLKSRGQSAVRQQIVEAVSDGLTAPEAFLHAVALYKGEDRTVDYIALPKALVEPIEEPSADVLGKWFEENKKTYAAPEYRKLAYVRLAPEDISDPTAITDEQVKADYEANKSKFTTAETRTIEQIVFKSADAAKAARDSIRSGSTFEEVLKAEGKTQADVQLGALTKEKIADGAVADAAFKLTADDVSEVIQSAFGPVLIRVTEIKPEVVRPLEEVKEEIRADLALVEANRVLLDVHDSYEDARAGGSTLREAAAKLKLPVVSVDAIDRAALRPDGSVVDNLPESQELLRAAFETEVNVENPAINLASNGFLFYEVEAVTPARDRTLDEVREKVVADWKAAETQSRLLKKAAELEKRVKDGATLETLANDLKLDKQTKRGLKREANDVDFGKPGIAAIFGVSEGGTGLVPSPAGDAQLLFKVTEVFEPAGAGPDSVPEEERKTFASGLSNDLLDQLVARLQTEYEVTVDRAAIEHALAF
jgi:peptidyl-prolyl cis-trans isomerase D